MMHSLFSRRTIATIASCVFGWALFASATAQAELIDSYEVRPAREFAFAFQTGAANHPVVFDNLPDGRLLAIATSAGSGAAAGTPQAYLESNVGTREFHYLGDLPGGPEGFATYGASFLKVSPTGNLAAVGNNRTSFGVMDFSGALFPAGAPPAVDPVAGTPLVVPVDWRQTGVQTGTSAGTVSYIPFSAAWHGSNQLAVSSGIFTADPSESLSKVSLLEIGTVTQRDIITGVAGATGGVAFDAAGALYTGNGFASGAGATQTGEIKTFDAAAWVAAFNANSPIAFEDPANAVLVQLLSAQGLEIDSAGNLIATGGDFSAGDFDTVAIYSALATLRRNFDPSSDFNFYTTVLNEVTGEVYAYDAFSSTPSAVYVIAAAAVPEPSSIVLAVVSLGALLALGRRRGSMV